MGDAKTIRDQALIVCTRNRYFRLQKLMDNLANCIELPSVLVIVDSSDEKVSAEILDVWQSAIVGKLIYVHSAPGLPLQRCVGMDVVARLPEAEYLRICNFLDDDVEINIDYFKIVGNLFSEEDMAALGAFDSMLPLNKSNALTRALGLSSKDSGTLLESGVAIAPCKIRSSGSVQWVAGHSVAYRWPLIHEIGFDSTIRMYGEDVEVCLRLKNHGEIRVHQDLYVKHQSENIGRESLTRIHEYSSGFRWRLARQSNIQVSKPKALIATFALMFGGLLISPWKPSYFGIFKGNLKFLLNVIFRREVEQKVVTLR